MKLFQFDIFNGSKPLCYRFDKIDGFIRVRGG